MGLFLYLSCISLGLSCQKILPKTQAPKRQKGENGWLYRGGIVYRRVLYFLDTITMSFMCYIIEIMNDGCYVFSS